MPSKETEKGTFLPPLRNTLGPSFFICFFSPAVKIAIVSFLSMPGAEGVEGVDVAADAMLERYAPAVRTFSRFFILGMIWKWLFDPVYT